ncbi:MAG: PAS domain S-box protein, partial [Halobacteriales archaeon]|nr:PAS domain S-box protein [Halobacteriales archaeon]
MEDFIATASVALHAVGPDGRILWANPAELAMMGYARDDYVGRHIAEFHVDQPVIEDILARLLRGERIVAQPARLRARDGSVKHALIDSSSRFIEGRFANTRCFTRDVTREVEARLAVQRTEERQRAAAEKLALYGRILSASNDAIAIIDAQGRYLEQNHAHAQLTGYADDELEGLTPAVHLGEATFARIHEELEAKGTFRGECMSQPKHGPAVPVDLAAFSVRDAEGRTVCHVGIKRDVSLRKRNEALLQRRLAHLQAIHELGLTVGQAASLEEIYDAALACIERTLADRAAVLLFDADRVMRFKAWRGLSDGYRAAVEGHTPWSPETTDALPVLVPDVRREAGLAEFQGAFQAEGIGSLAFLPLVHQGLVIGKFMVYHRGPHAFDAEEVQLAGTIAGHVGLGIGRMRAAEPRARLAAIVESSTDAIVSKNLDGVIQTWNPGAERIFGYRAEDIVGQPVTRLIPAERLGEEEEILRRLRRGERVEQFETQRVRKDGRVIDVSLTISPIRDEAGRIIGASKIARDITERKRAEQELRAMNERLQELDRMKTQLINTASHELRTPLTPITLQLDLLRARDMGTLTPRQRHALDILDR